MTEIYLFDWGDTLMVDFPGQPGKMCRWEHVEAVPGAAEVLHSISGQVEVYVASGAAQSSPADIEEAFRRVGLDRYISGYYCKNNIGIEKGSPDFLSAILADLNRQPGQATMVGDNFEKDILPALALGLRAIWISDEWDDEWREGARVIASLTELCR